MSDLSLVDTMSFYNRNSIRERVWTMVAMTGVLWVWRFFRRNQITILMLHGVMDEEQPTSWVPLRPQLSRRAFDESLSLLAKYYHFISLEDAVGMLTGRVPIRPYSLVLTFDDGYRNNLTHALPILQKYHVPAVFFVVPGHMEQQKPFWFDRLDYILQYAKVDGRRVSLGGSEVELRGNDRRQLRDSYRELRDRAKVLPHDFEMQRELEALARDLEQRCGQRLQDFCREDDWSAILTWDDVRSAAAHGVTIGSHTMDHVRLGLVEAEIAEAQLMQSKAVIERQMQAPCHYFCYPNGSLNTTVVGLVRQCGYEAAVTTEEGVNGLGQDPMRLRRFPFPETGKNLMTVVHVSGLSFEIGQWREQLRRLFGRA